MAGGVADALARRAGDRDAPTVEGPATPMGVPLSLLAGAIFLGDGRPGAGGRGAGDRRPRRAPRARRGDDLVGGITLAVALGGPLLAAAVVIEVAGALIARAASPAQVHTLIAPLRALGTLAVTAVVLERLAVALAKVVEAAP